MGNDDANEFDPSGLFVPDITEAVFESALTVEDTSVVELSLPELQAFWVDLVNKERVTESGEGVYVAVLDTGLLPQWPFFFSEANIAMEYCKGFSHDITWNGGLEISPVQDDRGCITDLASGHGTHVTSTVVGFNFNNLVWVSGVAPEATIIPVLVLDAWLVDSPFGTLPFSGGTDAMIAAGINYVADLSETLDGPVVINMSLGGPNPEPLIEAAVDYAISKGVIVVASAGNSGTAGMGYPGGLNQIISAGAAGYAQMFDFGWTNDVPENLKSQDSLGNTFHVYLEDFSSRPVMEPYDQKHQNLDVSAPGAWVVGPYKSAFANNTGYYYLSGTSMAAPHVSAIAALVLENHPDLTQTEMEFILSLGAQSFPLPASDAVVSFPFTPAGYYTATWDGGDYGAGFLQAPSAIQFAKTLGK
jgi:subtilisin family serine protease